jgi:putative ABC transport system ATP-binding protein
MDETPLLKTAKLSKEYGTAFTKVEALKEVDLSIFKGEFLAVMGPSGSGKSTLLHLLGGLDNPSSGKIFMDGREISGLPDKDLTLIRRKNVGFVFQFFNLLPTLTAEENIILPLLIAGEKPKQYLEKLNLLLEHVGIIDRRTHRPEQLSGGEQQRVAIARALISDPSVILADEPTGNLDSHSGKEILKLLQVSVEKFHQTVVMVTHDPTAASYADRVIFLRDGRIIHEIELGSKNDPEIIIAWLKKLEL